MGKKSKTKGAAGERELAGMLREQFPHLSINRNWMMQAAAGGSDLIGVPGWSIECKRAKVLRLGDWWTQTCVQALKMTARPVLIYRQDRGAWMAQVSLYHLRPEMHDHSPCTMTLESWCKLVRLELLDAIDT